MRISDWSLDVCSSDLQPRPLVEPQHRQDARLGDVGVDQQHVVIGLDRKAEREVDGGKGLALARIGRGDQDAVTARHDRAVRGPREIADQLALHDRSEEHTSELQSLMRISYAVFCLKKKK